MGFSRTVRFLILHDSLVRCVTAYLYPDLYTVIVVNEMFLDGVMLDRVYCSKAYHAVPGISDAPAYGK